MHEQDSALFTKLEAWASSYAEIVGLLLVGSYARGAARTDSDVDLMVLTNEPQSFFRDRSWLALFGDVSSCAEESWGNVTTLRASFTDGPEIEFNFATPDWARLPGAKRVIDDGVRVLFDRTGNLVHLTEPGPIAPAFVPGLVLAERFYHDAVRPILDRNFSELPHSAGLIGAGSEVLGFDTPVSSDHHWGPRVQLFVTEEAYTQNADAILEVLRHNLPHTFLGWPTSFTEPNPDDHGTQLLRATTSGPVNHRVDVTTPRRFFLHYLGFDLREALDPIDWLTLPSQKLRSIVASELFHDAIGLDDARHRFEWYPHDVWLYLLASGWQRIGQQEHLMGRAGQVGDEVGSALVASLLVRDLMRLCFLMERQYAPYAKWYGTAFAQLKSASALTPLFSHALRADTWVARDRALGEAYAIVAEAQNALAMSEPQPAEVQRFFGRPFSVIFGERFAKALQVRIKDSSVKEIPLLIGSIDQLTDSTDVLEATALRARLKALYHPAQ